MKPHFLYAVLAFCFAVLPLSSTGQADLQTGIDGQAVTGALSSEALLEVASAVSLQEISQP